VLSPQAIARNLALIGTLIAVSSPSVARAASANIRVTDQRGARIPGAVAFFVEPDGKLVRRTEANSVGEIVFTGLPLGKSNLIIYHPGFKNRPVTVTLFSDAEPWIEVVMSVEETNADCAENAVCL
jgi:hypothetical protein